MKYSKLNMGNFSRLKLGPIYSEDQAKRSKLYFLVENLRFNINAQYALLNECDPFRPVFRRIIIAHYIRNPVRTFC